MKQTKEYLLILQTLSMVLEGKNRKALLWVIKLAKAKDEGEE